MAEETKGTAHFFGIGAELTNATLLSVNLTKNFNLVETTVDEDGITIEERFDDRQIEGSVTMRLKNGYTFPDIGSDLVLAGLDDADMNKTYTVVSKGQVYQGNTHMEQTLELRWREGTEAA